MVPVPQPLRGACAPSPSVVILAESPPGRKGASSRALAPASLYGLPVPARCALAHLQRCFATPTPPAPFCSRPAGCRPPPAAPSATNLSPPLRLQHSHRPATCQVPSALQTSKERAKSTTCYPPAHLGPHPSSPSPCHLPIRSYKVGTSEVASGSTWQGMVGARQSRRFHGWEWRY